jgi:hypothetical protein
MSREAFDSIMRPYGGLLNTAAVPVWWRNVYELERRRAERIIAWAGRRFSNRPQVYFDFTNNADLNAVATRYADDYFIAINNGVLGLFIHFFCRVLADRGALRHIGSPDDEISDLPVFTAISPNANAMYANLGSRFVSPLTEVRQQYAQLLMEFAFDFLLAHEHTHINNGHVDFWAQKQGTSFLVEFSSDASNGDLRLTRQTLEVDADSFATCFGLEFILRCLNKPSLLPPPWDKFYRDPSQVFFNHHFAIHSLFRFFGDVRFLPDLSHSWYPPVRLRQTIAPDVGVAYLKLKAPHLVDSYLQQVMAAGQAAEEIFARVSGAPDIAIEGLKDASSDTGSEHYGMLLRRWKEKVRSELLPFAWGNLPA